MAKLANVRAEYVYVISNIGAFGENVVTPTCCNSRRTRSHSRTSCTRYSTTVARTCEHRREFFFITPQEVRDALVEKVGCILEFKEAPESLCGVMDGRDVVTTMGFTPLDGLVMATRSGSIDPGALLWLAEHTDEDLPTVLEHESGLQGIAGTPDMTTVLARADTGDAAAELALSVWLHRFLRQAGGCIAVLGGLDALVFTGGVGEHSATVRAMVCDRLAWLGPTLSDRADRATDDILDISASAATVRTFVTHAREDRQMLSEVRNLR